MRTRTKFVAIAIAAVAGLSLLLAGPRDTLALSHAFWVQGSNGQPIRIVLNKDENGNEWAQVDIWDHEGDSIVETIIILGEDNPDPESGEGDYKYPWEKRPDDPDRGGPPPEPGMIGLNEALQMDGGAALVEGKSTGHGPLINPSDDSGGDQGGSVKPKTQTSVGPQVGSLTQDWEERLGIEEQIGAPLATADQGYVQVHNPAPEQQSAEGGDGEESKAGASSSGAIAGSGGGIAPTFLAEFNALINPAPRSVHFRPRAGSALSGVPGLLP